MEEAFKNLKDQGKNNLDGIIQWMKNAHIIDGKTVTEDKVRKLFGNASGPVETDKFKEAICKLAKDTKTGIDELVSKLCNTGVVMENAFEKLKKDGKDNVDSIIQWMKDSKIIDSAKESEQKARKLLADVKDKQHVEMEKFKDTVNKVAEDTENKLTDMMKLVQEQGPKLKTAFQAATSAFKDAMEKK